MKQSRNILVAPLNWGLGHACRCIPVICELQHHGFNPIIAGDGQSLDLLRHEFPDLTFLELPSYRISYPRNSAFFTLKILELSPGIVKAIRQEHELTRRWVSEYQLSGIISDNRFGVYSHRIPTVYLTHQLNIAAGPMSWIAGKIHKLIIRKFSECWVPDHESGTTLSGKLGHSDHTRLKVVYLGPLSRFRTIDCKARYKLMVLLSGPEPQRSLFEEIIQKELLKYSGSVLLVRGVVEEKSVRTTEGHITTCNFLTTEELEIALNESEMILARSGYTTLMDLAILRKKAFFVPTPGQYEQEYLAYRMKMSGTAPASAQQDFSIEDLKSVDDYRGLRVASSGTNWKKLFGLFEGKGEF